MLGDAGEMRFLLVESPSWDQAAIKQGSIQRVHRALVLSRAGGDQRGVGTRARNGRSRSREYDTAQRTTVQDEYASRLARSHKRNAPQWLAGRRDKQWAMRDLNPRPRACEGDEWRWTGATGHHAPPKINDLRHRAPTGTAPRLAPLVPNGTTAGATGGFRNPTVGRYLPHMRPTDLPPDACNRPVTAPAVWASRRSQAPVVCPTT